MSSTDEWKMQTWYIYTMRFYSDVKKSEIMKLGGKWMVNWKILYGVR